MNFSDKLKRIIELEEINLKNFSDLTALNYDTVRRYKAGSRSPTLDQIKKILAVPRFEKYKEFLLSDGSSVAEVSLGDPAGAQETKLGQNSNPLTNEALELINRLKALGKWEEAMGILRVIEENAKK